jgi:hypothetical protein
MSRVLTPAHCPGDEHEDNMGLEYRLFFRQADAPTLKLRKLGDITQAANGDYLAHESLLALVGVTWGEQRYLPHSDDIVVRLLEDDELEIRVVLKKTDDCCEKFGEAFEVPDVASADDALEACGVGKIPGRLTVVTVSLGI